MRTKLILLLAMVAISACVKKPVKLKTGNWRGVLTMKTGAQLPFNFVLKDTAGKLQIAIVNGPERFVVPDVTQDGDSVFIKMPLFDSEFKLQVVNGQLKGQWIKHLAQKDNVMEFTATHG